MQIGIKIGPIDFKKKLEALKNNPPDFCEIHFTYNDKKEHEPIFEELKKRKIKAGIHYWGMIKNGKTYTNFATTDDAIRNETLRQIKDTIKIARNNRLLYVVAHFSPRILMKKVMPKKAKFSADRAEHYKNTLESTDELNKFAKKSKIPIIFETCCVTELRKNTKGKKKVYFADQPSPLNIEEIAKLNRLNICQDFAHMSTWIPASDRKRKQRILQSFSIALKPFTKLIHIGSIDPSSIGYDTDNGLTDKEIKKGNFPNWQEVGELLKGLNKKNMLAICEPQLKLQDHFWHYKKLKSLLKNL